MTLSAGSESNKNAIRIDALAKRGRITEDVIRAAEIRLEKQLVDLIPSGAIIGGYWAFRGELNITPALNILAGMGHSLCLPVIEAEDMPLYFRRWRPTDPVEPGRYGIPVPPAGAPVFKPDVLLVPLVAFDRRGYRLGYGAGYYDRTIDILGKEKQLLTIGVGYGVQEVEHLPDEEWDQKMDIVVTDKEVIQISS